MDVSAYSLAQRFIGLAEFRGPKHHPFIQWCHSLCTLPIDTADEVPWCSSFANGIAWMLRLPRSKSAAARSWLSVGEPVPLEDASVGFDVVVFKRGTGKQPGPEVIEAPGHVGFYGGFAGPHIFMLGGNQADQVSVAPMPAKDLLGVRRLVS